MTPTPEQLAIVEAVRNTQDNILISALAGAAKTSTLILIAQALPTTPLLCLAFNKKIADEMTERLPGNCTAMTLNSLGHRAWADALGKRLTLNTKKTYEIVSEIIGRLPQSSKDAAYDRMADLMRAVDGGKTAGWIPDGHYTSISKSLMTDDEFEAWLDDAPTDLEWNIIHEATLTSLKLALDGNIDFNDQILMPTLFKNASFPVYPHVLVDEAQDLSNLNHEMLRKLAKKRLTAVGDECQGIYGFRGAHQNSMALLEQRFNMRRMILSISFRCPISVVKAAQWRAPHMRWPEWAVEGTVTSLPKWTAADIPERAAIICRNNAPLFRMALRLLKLGKYPQIVGNDVGKNLLKIMRKFGKSSMPQAEVLAAIDAWKIDKLKRTRSPGSINDQADCFTIFAQAGDNLGDALAYAEHIFNSQGPILLMTGHKSKGLEFDHVFFLDQEILRLDDEGQDKNLKYVIQTRAKQTLTYVTTEGWSV